MLTAAITASVEAAVPPASSSVLKESSLAIQMPSGGTPVSEARKIVISAPIPGAYVISPPNELISPLCVLRLTAITTAKAPRFEKA